MSFNLVVLFGNLTRDPELKYLSNGIAVCSFSIAVNDVWKDDKGEKQEHVNYIDCEVFSKTAETISEYFKKGDPILISGSLKQQRWQDKDTEKTRSKVIVRVLSFQFTQRKPKEEGAVEAEVPSDAPPF